MLFIFVKMILKKLLINSINYAASMTMALWEYAGDFEDQFSARTGFVWKLGKTIKPTQISMKEGKKLIEEISALKENNSKDLAIFKLK